MCGVVGGLGLARVDVLDSIAHRGPDARGVHQGDGFWLGHVRLSILDLDARSDQPFLFGDLALVYNGELWNYRELRAELEDYATFETDGDTEVVAVALERWGEAALERFEGMFALAWTRDGETFHLARDRFGEVPLHVFLGERFAFASELKALVAMGLDPRGFAWVEPGEVWTISSSSRTRRAWYTCPTTRLDIGFDEAAARVREAVRHGALERAIADVPVCALLSGGIDSAAVVAHLCELYPNLVTYVAVFDPKSRDVRAARRVAEHLGVELREVIVPAPTADDLAGIVGAIEMPHKAQVEIAWACDVLGARMKADGFRVTYSGEGSDELWASYGMSYHGIEKQGWFAYRRELFLGQHRKNFARCNKVFMRHGVECRLPFLSTPLVELALSLPENAVRIGRSRPKAVIQEAHAALLPDEIVKRPKLAFQDGMGIKDVCAEAVASPERFYRIEHERNYAGAKT